MHRVAQRASGLFVPQTGQAIRSMSSPSAATNIAKLVNSNASGDVYSALKSWPATQVSKLNNGLRVASESSPVQTATIGVWIDTGSRYENEKNSGTAHFLEHMFFKGTPNRTRTMLEKEIEDMGGHLNAYTSRETTVFYAKVFKKDVPKAVEILGDILNNSDITEEKINNERRVIQRELEEVEKNLEEFIFDRLHQTAYRNTPLARTILGSRQQIENISRDDIKNYIASHYTAPRMVISGAGAVDHAELTRLAEKHFGHVSTKPSNNIEPVKARARFTGSDILCRYDDMPVAFVAYAFPTSGWNDPLLYPLMLIQGMIGSWSKGLFGGIHHSSPLVAEIAKYDLAHSFSGFNTQYSDTGLFGIQAVADPTCLHTLMYHFTKALKSFSYGVDEALLEQAKKQFKISCLSALDGTTNCAESIGRELIYHGRRIHPLEVMARIDAVDAKQIMQTARKYFMDRDHALAAIGPIHELPDYNWIRSRSYSHLV